MDGEGCTRKDRCWRFLAPSNEYSQAYMAPEIRGVGCGYFWEVEPQLKKEVLNDPIDG